MHGFHFLQTEKLVFRFFFNICFIIEVENVLLVNMFFLLIAIHNLTKDFFVLK